MHNCVVRNYEDMLCHFEIVLYALTFGLHRHYSSPGLIPSVDCLRVLDFPLWFLSTGYLFPEDFLAFERTLTDVISISE